MCTDAGHERGDIAMASPRPDRETEVPDPVSLVPADAVTLTTLVDNNSDLLLADQGPVKRAGLLAAVGAGRLPSTVLDTGETFDIPLAEHGFAMGGVPPLV
jgi:hypothetical protein